MLGRIVRILIWAAYFGGSTFLMICLTVGVYRSSRERVGRRPTPSAAVQPRDLQACSAGLDALFTELNDQLQSVPASEPGASQDARWETWAPGWRNRLLETAGRCRLLENEPPEAEPLRDAYRKLDRLEQLYTTHVVQYSREIGRLADDTRGALKKARESYPSR